VTEKYKGVPRVRMTLTPAIQNRVLHQLSTAFGIQESWDRVHEITCYSSDFGHFMSLLAKMDSPPTLKQLKVEYVDIRKDIKRTSVHQRPLNWEAFQKEDDELPVEPAVVNASFPVDYRSDAVNFGDALNEAGWIFSNECPEKSATLFNNIKAPLRLAILKYLDEVDKKNAAARA
jgi:hypothetical protein